MSYLDDDGSSLVIAVEKADSAGHRQSLWVRVGSVWYGETEGTAPVVWIEYQEEHMGSDMTGPVMLDIATWKELNRAVRRNIRRWRGPTPTRMVRKVITSLQAPQMRKLTRERTGKQ